MKKYPSQINKYELIRPLGNGHFGDVFLANDLALDQEKAIKIIDINNPAEFLHKLEEAQILNKCKHKNIVLVNEANVYEIDNESKVIIDMEFIDGSSLDKLMESKFISSVLARNLFIDVLFGLEYAHSLNILHRDIKPANILIDRNVAKLSDFGLATILGTKKTGSFKGYRPHIAPETYKNRVTDIKTDIYSMGVTLFRVVNNMTDWLEVIEKIDDPEKQIITGKLLKSIGYKKYVSTKIKRIINKATNFDAKKRYEKSSDFRADLEKLKPNIEWQIVSNLEWNGKNQDNQVFSISLSIKRTIVVDFKRNSRRIKEYCKNFTKLEDATLYIYSLISETSFE